MFDRMFLTLQLLRGDFAARLNDEEGATAVEYGLLVALIAAIIVGVVAALGIRLDAVFCEVSTAIGGAC